jgi:hypothetical protein
MVCKLLIRLSLRDQRGLFLAWFLTPYGWIAGVVLDENGDAGSVRRRRDVLDPFPFVPGPGREAADDRPLDPGELRGDGARESAVSAIAKKVKKGVAFVRTAPIRLGSKVDEHGGGLRLGASACVSA